MKLAAVLLDGGFLRKKLRRSHGGRHPTAREVVDFARSALRDDEELFRIYFYDCLPSEESITNPISGSAVDLKDTELHHRSKAFLESLCVMDHVAFRAGHLMLNGWQIPQPRTDALLRTGRSPTAEDLRPALRQKGVDMKIGLDIAWLSSKRIVDRIVLVTADTDFVPAMKFARREGVQVVLVTLDDRIRRELREHADEVRRVPSMAASPDLARS